MALIEYKPGATFPGNIGLTVDQSSPDWPESLRAREGTPNVLFLVLDGTGRRGEVSSSSMADWWKMPRSPLPRLWSSTLAV